MVGCVWGREEERARQKGQKRPRTSPNRTSGARWGHGGAPGRWRRQKRAKWPRLDGTFSAVVDDSGPEQRRPGAYRPRPRVPHPVSCTGQEKIRKKSSYDSPTILNSYCIWVKESGIASRSGTPLWHASRHSTGASERPRRSPQTPPSSVDVPVPNASTEHAGAVQRLREGGVWRRQRRDAVSELTSFSVLPYNKGHILFLCVPQYSTVWDFVRRLWTSPRSH